MFIPFHSSPVLALKLWRHEICYTQIELGRLMPCASILLHSRIQLMQVARPGQYLLVRCQQLVAL